MPLLLDDVEQGLREREGEEDRPLGDQIKFQMMVLAEVVRVPGTSLLPYLPRLQGVLQGLTCHSSKEGDQLTGSLLRNLLRSLTHVCPLGYSSVPGGVDKDLATYRPLQDWGVAGEVWDLDVEWFIPGEKEVVAAQAVLDTFLGGTLDRLERCAKGQEVLTREQMLACLSLVGQGVQGAGGLMPSWDQEILVLKPTRVDLRHQSHVAFKGQTPRLTLAGRNGRQRVVEVLHSLLKHLLANTPDDTKALIALSSVYQKVLFFAGVQRDEYDSRWKGFQAVKKGMENKLLGSKKHIRRILVDRTHLQHESRMIENANKNFTSMHREMYADLLLLSTSHYAEVRIKGQEVLGKAMKFFSYSYEEVVPHLINLLKGGEEVSHEQFKGVLYLILGPKGKSLLIKHNWETFASLLPAVLAARPSEKPSIIKVFSAVQETVVHHLESLTIKLDLPNTVIPPALALWDQVEKVDDVAGSLEPSCPAPSAQEVEEGAQLLEQNNTATLKLFQSVLNSLCAQLESGNLHWRQYNAGFAVLATLTRYDVPLSAQAVRIMMSNLVHDNIIVRKVAIHNMAGVLRQHKKVSWKGIIVSNLLRMDDKMHVKSAGPPRS